MERLSMKAFAEKLAGDLVSTIKESTVMSAL